VGVRCMVMSGAFKVVGGKSVVSRLVEKGGCWNGYRGLESGVSV
jgi:hypothetical protein